MSKIKSYVIAIGFLIFAGWLFLLFIANIKEADANIKTSLIGILGMFVVALFTHYQTKKREIAARHFADKRQGNMHMMDLLFDIIKSEKEKKKLSEKEMVKKILSFKKALIIWGGPDIIDAWNRFEIKAENELSSEEMLQEMEKILRAIRKDLGHDDSTLKFGSLWALMLTVEDKKKAIGDR